MEAELISTKALCETLGMGRKQAIFFCRKNGVEPINTSCTDSRTILRWRRSSVMRMLDTLEAIEKPAEANTIPRRKSKVTIQNKSLDDVIRELGLPAQ